MTRPLIMSIDVETTGLNLTGEDKSKVISLGAVVTPMDKRQPLYELEVFLDIFGETQARYINWDSKALQMNLGTLQRIKELSKNPPGEDSTAHLIKSQSEFGEILWRFIRHVQREEDNPGRVVLLGKNLALFDIPMLGDTLLNMVGEGGLNYKAIDIGNLYLRPEDNGKVPCLDECVKRAGGMGPVPHTALGDAKLVMELYRQWSHLKNPKDPITTYYEDKRGTNHSTK